VPNQRRAQALKINEQKMCKYYNDVAANKNGVHVSTWQPCG